MLKNKALSATAAGEEPVYVEDVFSTYLYTGNSTSGGSQFINNGLKLSDINEVSFTEPGTYSWYCPPGVTSVSVVCVGGGGGSDIGIDSGYYAGGGGGGLGYKNNISVTPGTSYTVVVGKGAEYYESAGAPSYFIDTATVAGNGGASGSYGDGGSGGTYVGDGGGNGGRGGNQGGGVGGGGGAGGYAGNGGDGAYGNGSFRTDGSGGGGAGGGANIAGGGVGIFGQGTSGVGSGVGGSGGTNGNGFRGGSYGGGANGEGQGGNGAVRIIWLGSERSFPTTDTAKRTDTYGGLVWIKGRSASSNNVLFDTKRGPGVSATINSMLSSNTQDGGFTATAYDYVSNITDTGFSVRQGGGGTATRGTNYSNVTYSSWSFRKHPKFFDVVEYTGNGANRTIAHGLDSVPGCIIIKEYSNAGQNWRVWHRSLNTAADEALQLNSTSTVGGGSGSYWNYTLPTSTTFSVGTDGSVNTNGRRYIAYLFAHDAGGFGDSGSESVIKCGSFDIDVSGTAAINLGWEPQWVLMKAYEADASWGVYDNMRGMPVGNTNVARFFTDTSGAEGSSTDYNVSPTATGFTAKATGYTGSSVNGFIYIAIRRGPMKKPTSGTQVFEPFVNRTSIADKINGTMGPVDFSMQTQVSSPLAGYHWTVFDRLRGSNYLVTAATSAETSGSVFFTSNTGIRNGTWFSSGGTGINIKRAPGFFDTVCYTGTGSNRTVTHSLGAVPELMIVKRRDTSGTRWCVYSAATTSANILFLDTTDASNASSNWNSTNPTSSVFSVGTSAAVNASGGTYVAYLFATLAGVSKVGSYTGTGNLLQINCGFTGSARFVLIKRTDTTGDWYVWDSARGIVAGDDPYLLLNSTATEVTNTDYIDTNSSGFELTAAASTTVNILGGTYIYLAIA